MSVIIHNLDGSVTEREYTKEELAAIASSQPSDADKLIAFKITVQEALDKSDLVALRAFKAGVAFGDEWTSYDSNLRALMSVTEWSESLVLPIQPESYPS